MEELTTRVEIKKLLGFLEYTRGSGFGYPISAVFMVRPQTQKLAGGQQTKEIGYFTSPPEKTIPEVKST